MTDNHHFKITKLVKNDEDLFDLPSGRSEGRSESWQIRKLANQKVGKSESRVIGNLANLQVASSARCLITELSNRRDFLSADWLLGNCLREFAIYRLAICWLNNLLVGYSSEMVILCVVYSLSLLFSESIL